MARSKRDSPPHEREQRIVARDLRRDDWRALELLFGANGACGGCWCMHWRIRGAKAWAEQKGEPNRRALRALVESGAARGVLAFAGDEPVGWCALGPKAEFARLAASRTLATDGPADTWSVPCFFVPTRRRGRGVASALLARAVAQARAVGVRRIEGYPVRVARGERYPQTFAFVGVPALFEQAGFTQLSRPGDARPIFALELGRGSRTK